MLPDFLCVWSFDYNWIWAIAGDVCPVKVNIREALSLFLRICDIIDVFPVPVAAVKNTGSILSINVSIIVEYE